MKKAVVYWSGTGNTEAMAKAVAEGITGAGAEAEIIFATDFTPDKVNDYDAIAFGCPSMGAEELEDTEFAPMFDAVLPKLPGKKIALFGSYGWGDGEWMRNWSAQCEEKGLALACDFVICNEAPDEDAVLACRNLGAALV